MNSGKEHSMKTHCVSAQETRNVDISTLPMGEYKGVWGGYEVQVEIYGVLYKLITETGIRTPAAPCVVRIQNGEATIEVVRHE